MLMDITERLNELKKLIVKYQDSYYKTGKSEVSDSEYDRLFDELLNRKGTSRINNCRFSK